MSRGIQIYGGGWFYGNDIRYKFSAYCTECDMLFARTVVMREGMNVLMMDVMNV